MPFVPPFGVTFQTFVLRGASSEAKFPLPTVSLAEDSEPHTTLVIDFEPHANQSEIGTASELKQLDARAEYIMSTSSELDLKSTGTEEIKYSHPSFSEGVRAPSILKQPALPVKKSGHFTSILTDFKSAATNGKSSKSPSVTFDLPPPASGTNPRSASKTKNPTFSHRRRFTSKVKWLISIASKADLESSSSAAEETKSSPLEINNGVKKSSILTRIAYRVKHFESKSISDNELAAADAAARWIAQFRGSHYDPPNSVQEEPVPVDPYKWWLRTPAYHAPSASVIKNLIPCKRKYVHPHNVTEYVPKPPAPRPLPRVKVLHVIPRDQQYDPRGHRRAARLNQTPLAIIAEDAEPREYSSDEHADGNPRNEAASPCLEAQVEEQSHVEPSEEFSFELRSIAAPPIESQDVQNVSTLKPAQKPIWYEDLPALKRSLSDKNGLPIEDGKPVKVFLEMESTCETDLAPGNIKIFDSSESLASELGTSEPKVDCHSVILEGPSKASIKKPIWYEDLPALIRPLSDKNGLPIEDGKPVKVFLELESACETDLAPGNIKIFGSYKSLASELGTAGPKDCYSVIFEPSADASINMKAIDSPYAEPLRKGGEACGKAFGNAVTSTSKMFNGMFSNLYPQKGATSSNISDEDKPAKFLPLSPITA